MSSTKIYLLCIETVSYRVVGRYLQLRRWFCDAKYQVACQYCKTNDIPFNLSCTLMQISSYQHTNTTIIVNIVMLSDNISMFVSLLYTCHHGKVDIQLNAALCIITACQSRQHGFNWIYKYPVQHIYCNKDILHQPCTTEAQSWRSKASKVNEVLYFAQNMEQSKCQQVQQAVSSSLVVRETFRNFPYVKVAIQHLIY